jgi:hypothetical protein
VFRAGANFSAISATDPNALRWDKLGYMHLLDLAAKDGQNAYVKETPSVEYWDELPSREKIDSMAAYLKDVSYEWIFCLSQICLSILPLDSSRKLPRKTCQRALHLA